MATKKKTASKGSKKPAARRATQKSTVKKAASRKTAVKKIKAPKPVKTTQVIYIDSCAFFPRVSTEGYVENGQEGRNNLTPEYGLMAPLPLPVNSVFKSVTIYYKNTTQDWMQVAILKKHIDHHCYTGEFEVSLDSLPPATLPPDNFVSLYIDHFADGGLVKDKYLYFIEISNTINNETGMRTVRGMRIEYIPGGKW